MVLPHVEPGIKYRGVGAGERNSYGITTSGQVIAWGANWSGTADVPNDLTNVIKVLGATHDSQVLALTGAGEVRGWGPYTNVPPDLTNITDVSVSPLGGTYTALRQDGTVVAWSGAALLSIPADLTNIVSVSTGEGYHLAVHDDGMVSGWGPDFDPDLLPPGLSNVVSVVSGYDFDLALLDAGTVLAWGNSSMTNLPSGLSNVTQLAAGPYAAAALKDDGTVIIWPARSGLGGFVTTGLTNVTSVAGGFDHFLFLTAEGKIRTTGMNVLGQSKVPGTDFNVARISIGDLAYLLTLNLDGSVTTYSVDEPSRPTLTNAVQIDACGYHDLSLTDDHRIISWAVDGFSTPSWVTNRSDYVQVASGNAHGIALVENGGVITWGDDTYGQITLPDFATDVVAVDAGAFHSIALMANGQVKAWGRNDLGQTNVPVGLANVVAVSAGFGNSMALEADGSVVAWGDPGWVPSGLSNVVQIAAGDGHCLALRADGTIAAWGRDDSGQINLPQNLSNAVGLAAGSGVSAVVVDPDYLPAQITIDPISQNLRAGNSLNLFVHGEGSPSLNYQWFRDHSAIPGATNDAYTIGTTTTNDSGDYFAIVSNQYGVDVSATATVFIYVPAGILVPPRSQAVPVEGTVQFDVVAEGHPTPSFEWHLDGEVLPGANLPSLTITNIGLPDLGDYTVSVSNAFGYEMSPPAVLSMSPSILSPFVGTTVIWGFDTLLSVEAIGSDTLTYQWYKDGVAIDGANDDALLVPSVQFANAGLYSVVVSSIYGQVTNTPAMLVVNPAGVSLGLYAGITIHGAIGNTLAIEYSTDLTDTNSWMVITNLTLQQELQLWVDESVEARAQPKRFYRVVPGP